MVRLANREGRREERNDERKISNHQTVEQKCWTEDKWSGTLEKVLLSNLHSIAAGLPIRTLGQGTYEKLA